MQEVSRIYQIGVIINDEQQRLLITKSSESGDGCDVILDIFGKEAATTYKAFLDIIMNAVTKTE